MRRTITTLVVISVIVVVLGECKDRSTPEQQVRATIAQAEQAAQEKDLKTLAGLLSDRFGENTENDRASVLRIVQLQFLRYPSIHLLVRVPAVVFPEPGHAEVTALVAMASLPLASAADLARASADLYRFDLVFVEEGKRRWRLRSAAWTPVRIEDFL
jgi:hypothetical protein